MKEKILDNIKYICSALIGLLSVITVCCPVVTKNLVLAGGTVMPSSYNTFEFLSSFSGTDNAGAGLFGSIIGIVILIAGVALLIYSVLVMLGNFGVGKLVKVSGLGNPEKTVSAVTVAHAVLVLFALIMYAVTCTRLSSDAEIYDLGGGMIALLVFDILLAAGSKWDKFLKIDFKKFADKFRFKKKDKASEQTVSESEAEVNAEATAAE